MEVTHRLRPPDETNGTDSYTDSYTYGPTGDRATATYATPAATMRWKYGDYVPIGDPLKDQRAFQTLTLLDSSGNPTAEEMHYSYDQLGRLQNAAFAQTPASGYTPPTGGDWYGTNPSMHLASVRARAFYTYDPGGRMLSVYHWWDTYAGSGTYSSTPILGNSCSYEYTGSKRGLKTGATYWTNSSGSFADAWDETYGYDSNFDYLTSFTTTDGQANASQSWSYDPSGNRTSDYTGTSWAYDNLNRMTANGAGTSCSNDVLGNRTALGSSVSYTCDCLNRMTGYANSSVTETYAYRADGIRVAKSNSSASTKYRYDGQMGMEDVDTTSSSTTVTEFGLGGRGIDYLAATTGSATNVAFPVYDAHGNMVATLARSGSSYSVANQRDFDPWGNVRGGSPTGDPKGRYCANMGHKQDDESSLLYMRARYYDATAGRFASEDPSKQGQNWAQYCGDDPVNHHETDGKSWLSSQSMYGTAGAIAFFIYFLIKFAQHDSYTLAMGAKFVIGSLTSALAIQMIGNTASPLNRAIRYIANWANSAMNLPVNQTQIALIAGYSLFLLFLCDNLTDWANH